MVVETEDDDNKLQKNGKKIIWEKLRCIQTTCLLRENDEWRYNKRLKDWDKKLRTKEETIVNKEEKGDQRKWSE